MASKEQLENALIAAHEAGDTEAAELIASEIKALPAAPVRPRTWGEQIKRDLGLTARSGLNAVAALPLMAMDMGVGARNLLTGSQYESASSMWKRGLTDIGFPQPEGLREKASTLGLEIAMGGRLPAPQAKVQVPKTFTPRDTVRAVTQKEAAEAGLVVPPSTTNPTITNKLLESLGGKVATQQQASLINQQVVNTLSNKALGRPEGAQLTKDAMQAVRNNVVEQAYKPVRGIGTIRLDTKFTQALDDVTAKVDKVAKQFPKLGDQDLTQTIQSLKSNAIDSDVAVDTISVLRDKASSAFAQGNSEAGRAYRTVAKAFEDAIERALERRGKDAESVLAAYRSGRQLIAKTHSVEKAINEGTGNVSAKALAQQLSKGAPLSGELATIARFGKAFPKAAQELTDSPVNNLDMAFSAGVAGLSGNPAALAYPFSREAARQLLLSPAGQRLATPGLSQASPRTALGLFYGANNLNGLLGQ